MSWRIITITTQSYLSLSEGSLRIRQGAEEFHVPLEDIGIVILEERSITLSVAVLDAMIQHKIALCVCDEKHMPSGALLGYQQHSRQSKIINTQISWSEPFKKRLWQQIIRQKIVNQKYILERAKGKEYQTMERLHHAVNSGDTQNCEATAARLYFSELLPDKCYRGSDHILNSALNYGYAILRGAIARSLVGYGFLSSIGVNHRNELDNFALADDFIEPYRPFVDEVVFATIPHYADTLTKEMKVKLISVLTHEVSVNGMKQSVLRGMEVTAQSLVTATNNKDPLAILLPSFIT
jgi:CRISP-associated protein Cas1